MKNNYLVPVAEVVVLNDRDVLTASKLVELDWEKDGQ